MGVVSLTSRAGTLEPAPRRRFLLPLWRMRRLQHETILQRGNTLTLRSALTLSLPLALALVLTGCGKSTPAGTSASAPVAFHHVDITGARYAQDLSGLVDSDGQPRTLADWRGKAVLIFFGYSRCPDVCPTTLAEAAEARRLLGDQANRLQVVMISLDPERDTPELLSTYVRSFDPSFVALRGDAETTRRVAQNFKIFYERVEAKSAAGYTLDHTAASYVIDPQGQARLYVRNGVGAQALADDLQQLLR